MSFNRIIILLTIMFLVISCNTSGKQERQTSREEMRESLLGANVLLIDAEEQEIEDFVERHGWDMKSTGSGLRYMIYEHGTGEPAQKDRIAWLNYTVSLLTGDLIYSSEEDGIRQFRIGRGGVESGLEEGILLLRVGDKARFIMPSHLAHGVPGDGAKIPKRATIVYDIELIDITYN
ncbi:MAG: peptidylprolyl isomerase [Bacteroidetes bacterium]|nr:MAG: peptidylprolyl isomerase [Bacteroidota bacterium]